MPFEELQHTADWALHIWAADLPALLAESARGMNVLSGAQPASGPRLSRAFEAEAPDVESLLVLFLTELVYFVEQERLAHVRREAKQKGEAEDLAKQLNGVTVTFTQKAGEADQLFGSVTSKDIVEALAKQDFNIDRRKIHLDEPIKQLGEHKIMVKLHPDVSVEIQVNVLREAEE